MRDPSALIAIKLTQKRLQKSGRKIIWRSKLSEVDGFLFS